MKKILFLILILLSTNAQASAPTRAFSYSPNTTIDPSQNNTNENALYSYLQVGVDTYAAGSITGTAISSAASIPYISLSLASSIVNADISASAAIVDTKLATISTAGKVSGAALTSLSSTPSGAGAMPVVNLGSGTATAANTLLGGGSWGYNPYVKCTNTQAQNTAGGTATSGAWRTIVLNTEDSDSASIATLASNQISLPAGTYIVRGFCPFSQTSRFATRLQNITDTSTILNGSVGEASASLANTFYSNLVGIFTISGTKTIEFQYQVNTTRSTDGFGLAANFGSEVYTTIEFIKVN